MKHPEGVPESNMATYANLNVHTVFATKGRAPLIQTSWRDEFFAYIGGTVRGLGAHVVAIGGIEDHVHLLMSIKATHSVADLVREIKKASSVWASQKALGFAWQTGYGAFTVGVGEMDRVVAYIANQEEHHRKISSQDEFRAILVEFGIEIDERFFE